MTRKVAAVDAVPAGRSDEIKCGELAGRSAADCAAVTCCCPCSVINLLLLAIYKVPTGLCRKAVRKRRQRVANKRRVMNHKAESGIGSVGSVSDVASDDSVADLLKKKGDDDGDKASGDFEKEMWARFNGAGFWRSPSARETSLFVK